MRNETKATRIPPGVKLAVYRRDRERCVLCGSIYGQPNAHVVRRSQGGLGVEENLVTLCPECHRAFDEGTGLDRLGHGWTREALYDYLAAYLMQFYPGWTRERVTYRKGRAYAE